MELALGEEIVVNYHLLLLLFLTIPLAKLLHKVTTPVSSWVSTTDRNWFTMTHSIDTIQVTSNIVSMHIVDAFLCRQFKC